jgi:hypothetical protein
VRRTVIYVRCTFSSDQVLVQPVAELYGDENRRLVNILQHLQCLYTLNIMKLLVSEIISSPSGDDMMRSKMGPRAREKSRNGM